jgi:hypothetical protein
MSDYHRYPFTVKARKEHRCIYCGGPILVDEQYMHQSGYHDGKAFRSRYHQECWGELIEESLNFEFTPYSGEYPEGIAAIVAKRAKATGSGWAKGNNDG